MGRAWRIVATGLCFAVFGIGGLILGGVAYLGMRLVIRDRDTYAQTIRQLISRSFRLFLGFMWVVGVLRWRVSGHEHWHRERPYLVVANHPSLIDIVFLIGYFQGADCVIKGGATRNPAWGLLVRAADYVSNESPELLLDECLRRLRAGRTVVLFPEGTRTVPGRPLQFGTGAGAIAVRSGCECLPVVISCNPPTLYKGLPWYRVPHTRPEFVLRVYPSLAARKVTDATASQRHAAREFAREMEDFFARQLGVGQPTEPDRTTQPLGTPVL